MSDSPVTPLSAEAAVKKDRRAGPLKTFWRKIRKPLAQSRFAKAAVATLLANWLRLVRVTNPLADGSNEILKSVDAVTPSILAIWHGQHLLAPAFYPRGRRLTAMISRSDDAEVNALIAGKFGVVAVRGSGGREDARNRDKGGARALIALKKVLVAGGGNVFMTADIPHGTPRQAGMGIVTLARLSGRPVIPIAVATSRRKVLEKSWDKTTINLPFGRGAVIFGEPVLVPADADDAEMERKRQEITARLNEATERAYRVVDKST
jgi:lysophospholipid acyltransferase (LPLAT)-like uncharacterized protein